MRLFTARLVAAGARFPPPTLLTGAAIWAPLSFETAGSMQTTPAAPAQPKKPLSDHDILATLDKLESARQGAYPVNGLLETLRTNVVAPKNSEIANRALRAGIDVLKDELYEDPDRFLAIGLLRNILDRGENTQIEPVLVGELYSLFRALSMGVASDACLAQLRLFEVLLRKQPPSFTKEELTATIERLSPLCYFGFDWEPATSAAPPGRLTAEAMKDAAGVTVDKPQNSNGADLKTKQSVSSLGSAVSRRRKGHLPHRNPDLPCDVRFKALQCLYLLANRYWRELHPHWHLFLDANTFSLPEMLAKETDPGNRLAIVRAIDALLRRSSGYLALAQEESRQTSFTSLSARLANTVIALHRRCAGLLSSSTTEEMRDAALELIDTLTMNTSYERIQTPILGQLASTFANMPVGRQGDLERRMSIWSNMAKVKRKDIRRQTDAVFVSAFKQIASELTSNSGQAKPARQGMLWQTLTAMAPRFDAISLDKDCTAVLEKLISHMKDTIVEGSQANKSTKIGLLIKVAQEPSLEIAGVREAAQATLSSIEPSSKTPKVLAKQAADLIGTMQGRLLQDNESLSKYLSMLQDLSRHSESNVKLASFRAMGKILKTGAVEDMGTKQTQELCELLLAGATDENVQSNATAEAAHVLADMLARPSTQALAEHEAMSTQLFELALKMASDHRQNRNVEMMRVESARLLGHLLGHEQGDRLTAAQKSEGRKALLDALNSNGPKVQWNAAVALQQLIKLDSANPDGVMIDALFNALRSGKNVKVRRSALAALEASPASLRDPLRQGVLQETIADLDSLQPTLAFEDAARAKQLRDLVQNVLDAMPAPASAPAPAADPAPQTKRDFALLGEMQRPGVKDPPSVDSVGT